jgi:hypothetical protein
MFDAREEGDRERNLQHAAAAYRQSLRVFPRGGEDWADATLSLADIEPPGEATVELYQDVVDALVEDFTFRGASEERSLEFGARATEGVQIAGRELMGGEVIVPEGFDDRKTLGPLIYLRPLMTSGRLILPNRFKDPAGLTVQYEREPEEMTLEGVLNRILAEHFSVVTLGGRPEGYGPSRIVIRDNWKQVFDFVLRDCVLIMIVPHVSGGVRWEVEQLLDREVLDKTLVVMPPRSAHFDAGAMWAEGSELFAGLGLHLPPYDDEGMFMLLGADGDVSESWSFNVVWSNSLLARLEPLLPQR